MYIRTNVPNIKFAVHLTAFVLKKRTRKLSLEYD
ncbi:Protein of unknown function [Bacillus wiedmannii]|nr:Protein of unknown function [Bacillus wiedmannii]